MGREDREDGLKQVVSMELRDQGGGFSLGMGPIRGSGNWGVSTLWAESLNSIQMKIHSY